MNHLDPSTSPDLSALRQRVADGVRRHERRRRRTAVTGTALALAIVGAGGPFLVSAATSGHAAPAATTPGYVRFPMAWSTITFADDQHGFALGGDAECKATGPSARTCEALRPVLLSTRDAGRTWQRVDNVDGYPGVLSEGVLVATSPSRLYAVGHARVLTSADGGHLWSGVALADRNSPADGYALPTGINGTLIVDVTVNNKLGGGITGCGPGLQRIAGSTRTTLTQPTVLVGAHSGLAAGVDGTLWRSQQPLACTDQTGPSAGGVQIFRSTDGGAHWQRRADPPGTVPVTGITAFDADHLWAIDLETKPGPGPDGPNTLRLVSSADGGATWKELPTIAYVEESTNNLMRSITLSDASDQQLIALSASDLLLTSGNQIYASHDAGATFTPSLTMPITHVGQQLITRLDSSTVLSLATDGTLRVSTDAGRTWTVRAHLS